jgi:hypothetical protein
VFLRQFYPRLSDFRISTSKGGWKRMVVLESYIVAETGNAATYEIDAGQLDVGQLNDGLLRILAILAQTESHQSSLLLLDEVVDGINPEIVEKLVDTLVRSPIQIIVTTVAVNEVDTLIRFYAADFSPVSGLSGFSITASTRCH